MSMVLVPSSRVPAATSFAVYLVQVLADGWNRVIARVQDAAGPYEPRTTEELLALADSYEATQPSYAADLRAAAERTAN